MLYWKRWFKRNGHLELPSKDEGPHRLSICGFFKNEAAYLKEWVEFHRVVSVEHFYLYDNNCTGPPCNTFSKLKKMAPWNIRLQFF